MPNSMIEHGQTVKDITMTSHHNNHFLKKQTKFLDNIMYLLYVQMCMRPYVHM